MGTAKLQIQNNQLIEPGKLREVLRCLMSDLWFRLQNTRLDPTGSMLETAQRQKYAPASAATD